SSPLASAEEAEGAGGVDDDRGRAVELGLAVLGGDEEAEAGLARRYRRELHERAVEPLALEVIDEGDGHALVAVADGDDPALGDPEVDEGGEASAEPRGVASEALAPDRALRRAEDLQRPGEPAGDRRRHRAREHPTARVPVD